MDEEEVSRRLQQLSYGPWFVEGQLARDYLVSKISSKRRSAKRAFQKLLADAEEHEKSIRFEKLDSMMSGTKIDKGLVDIFRDHRGRPVTASRELNLRDSLDEALSYIQLLEIAVESAYVPLESVLTTGRAYLVRLLWARGSRQFVNTYNYTLVMFFASRVGVDLGLPVVHPPGINPRAELRFAAFLSYLTDLYQNDKVTEWLRFLDDYVVDKGEKSRLRSFLRSGEKEADGRNSALVAGALSFCECSYCFFGTLPKQDRSSYALFLQYWLRKFLESSAQRSGRQAWCDRLSRFCKQAFAGTNPLSQSPIDEQIDLLRTCLDSSKVLANARDTVQSSGKTRRVRKKPSRLSVGQQRVRKRARLREEEEGEVD
jgi:hypothetical protein